MGMTNLRNLMGVRGVEIVALCDVDSQMLAKGSAEVPQAKTFRDWREMFAASKLDAVTASLPDHTHAAFSIWALNRGVDVYGEKPLAHHHAESLAIMEAAHRNGRIWQTGSWQRSVKNFRRAVELVRNGRIGKIQKVEVAFLTA
jgi:predicted dehydrogenase